MKTTFMTKVKNSIAWILVILAFVGIIGGIGFIKYKFWRAEHPTAKTWTFFILNGK